MSLIKKQNGYTIIETMIVLAVTSVMLTATTLLVSGQMARYKFREITYNSQQAIQNAINDVQTGYFDLSPAPASSLAALACVDFNSARPGNSDCVYVGKEVVITPGGQLRATPLVLKDKQNPTTSPISARLFTEKATTSQLPGGVKYGTVDTKFYVLFTNYPDTDNPDFTGGAQSVKIYNDERQAEEPTGGYKINLTEGARNACLIIGANGSLGVEMEPDPCP